MSEVVLNELTSFLNSKRVDLKKEAISTVCQLSGTEDGLNLIIGKKELLSSILNIMKGSEEEIKSFLFIGKKEYIPSVLNSIEDSKEEIIKQSFKTLVNVTARENGVEELISLDKTLIETLICRIQNKNYIFADLACGVLANITRFEKFCLKVLDTMHKSSLTIDSLFLALCQIGYNNAGQNLDSIASVLSNFTQISKARREILNKEKDYVERFISLIDSKSKTRRKAAIFALHNCTFEREYHDWLLSEEIDLSTRLAYPLAGPDVFTVEENESLPLDLQFLGDDKEREEDSELRAVLLESLMQFCTKRKHREHLRNQNIYLILREHNLWEQDKKCLKLNEDLVNLLIKYESEIGQDDLSKVEVPPHLIEKFEKLDADDTNSAEEDEEECKNIVVIM
ncbi:Protein HGH1-like protein [Armadillidium vulgare]|nr:Protein HGH1-like protein [Armadillidium vulgare]